MVLMRAQASLDFLMTYGWALLLITLVAAAIVGLGILDTGSYIGSRAIGFSQITPVGWSLDNSGVLKMKLKNNAGSDINITQMVATQNSRNITNASVINVPYGKDSGVFSVGSLDNSNSGASYSVNVKIYYNDSETGFPYVDSGTLSGRVISS